ncbi:E3 ubiquitin/ISG15 ligase TRIM25-like [Anomaloglossus baeobatrachus]|uniref:E3 ubiquitin/ISG15 ligase TRIM25-like n=1 Tax=Anomaloglossus baeobatrachus TaxID=238106 RepID=UPI003F5008CE
MASADLREDLECSICLTLYTDPVTLRCGHNFCRECIDRVLDTQDESGVYSCPDCREKFNKRPTLKRNITLCNVAERFLSTQSHQEEITGILCTYCIDSPAPAVRSCLHCEASLCDNHLRVHSKGPEHVLTDPSTSLEKRKCSVHKELLKYYCTEDAACICVSCSLAGKHRGHRVEMLDEASEKKKKKLRKVFQKLITNREKTEEKVRSLEERKRKFQEKASREAKRVTAVITDIRRRVDNLEKKVLSEISRREEKVSLSDVIQKLELKKDELSRKMRHIEELYNMTDPLTILQDPDTSNLCGSEEDGGDEDTGGRDGGDEDTGGHDGGDEDTGGRDGGDEDTGGHDGGDGGTRGHNTHDIDVDIIRGMLDAGFRDIMTFLQNISPKRTKVITAQPSIARSVTSYTQVSHFSGIKYGGSDVIARTRGDREKVMEGGIYGEGPADILLDVNTAHNNLLISDYLKTATCTGTRQNRPETAKRFQDNQVMSNKGFTSGRHYWDVEISGSGRWKVGMCYPSIARKGGQSYIGYNNKSWGLFGRQVHNNQYSVIPDSTEIRLPQQITSDGVRICLDYGTGQLSFYELCDPIRHLHTFTATFTEPLHATLWVWTGSIKISGGEAVRNQHRRRILPSNS